MNKKLLFAAVLMAGLFTACGNDNENEPTDNKKLITISTQIGQMTRVSTQADGSQVFTEGDEISIYAWTGDNTTVPDVNRVVNNSVNKLTSGNWVASPLMLWSDQTSQHYFIGVYPKTTTAVTNLMAMPYTFNANDETASDLLVATNLNGLTAQSAPVPLVFDHVMGRVVVNFSYRSQFGGTPTIQKVVMKGAMTNANVNCLTKVVTANGDKSDVTLSATGVDNQYGSIIIPQSGLRQIVVTIDGADYTFAHTQDITIESGKVTTINLIVGRDEIILGGITINDWQKGTEIDGGEAL